MTKTKKRVLSFMLAILMTSLCSIGAFAFTISTNYFVFVSEKYDANGRFRASTGYLGETSYNGKTAFNISPNATIYGGIGKVVTDSNGSTVVDHTVALFRDCNISTVIGSGTVSKVAYHDDDLMFPGTYYCLKFSGQSGTVYHLNYYFNWHGEVTATECYFIVN